jgi:hypothetical protein
MSITRRALMAASAGLIAAAVVPRATGAKASQVVASITFHACA